MYIIAYTIRKLDITKKKKIGRDFTTSPEISQLFGECISIFILNFVRNSNIESFCELGPGNGTLMKDLIITFSKLSHTKKKFYLHEKSEFLALEQKKMINCLKDELTEIFFLKKFSLKKKPFFFFCNEFFDSLPTNQYIKRKNSWYENRIKIFNEKFKKIEKKTDFYSKDKLYAEGDIIEKSPLLNLYQKRIFKHIKKFGGALLLFDYGPYKKRKIDTIQAIHKSKKCNYIDFPFKSDITYHIDFDDFKEVAKEYGLHSYGPISQQRFLYFNGINERALNLIKNSNLSDLSKGKIELGYQRLVDPLGMGRLIKCILITKNKNSFNMFRKLS